MLIQRAKTMLLSSITVSDSISFHSLISAPIMTPEERNILQGYGQSLLLDWIIHTAAQAFLFGIILLNVSIRY